VHDYTSGALDGYDKDDVAGLLEDRLTKARERLEETRESSEGSLRSPFEAPKIPPPTCAILRQRFRQRRATEGQRAEAPRALYACCCVRPILRGHAS